MTKTERLEIYREHGAESRLEYITNLAYEHDVPLDEALTIACLFGPDEDFDGLVCAMQDYEFYKGE